MVALPKWVRCCRGKGRRCKIKAEAKQFANLAIPSQGGSNQLVLSFYIFIFSILCRHSIFSFFLSKVWSSSFSLGIPLPHYLFNPLNLNFNPFNPNLPKFNFQLLSRGNPQLPLWQQTAPGRGNKFSSSFAYQVPFFSLTLAVPSPSSPSLLLPTSIDLYLDQPSPSQLLPRWL